MSPEEWDDFLKWVVEEADPPEPRVLMPPSKARLRKPCPPLPRREDPPATEELWEFLEDIVAEEDSDG